MTHLRAAALSTCLTGAILASTVRDGFSEPVTLTAGAGQFNVSAEDGESEAGLGRVRLFGPGLALDLFQTGGFQPADTVGTTTYDPSGHYRLFPTYGTAIVHGMTMLGGDFMEPRRDWIWMEGSVTIDAAPVVLPARTGPDAIVQRSFTLAGWVIGHESSQPIPSALFQMDFTGAGQLVLYGNCCPDPARAWRLRTVEFTVGNPQSPAPVPEPASVLLVAAGLAALLRWRATPRRG